MLEPARRTSRFTESVIRDMSRVALAHGALNLAQGFPDFDPPEILLQALRAAVGSGMHQYANTWGAPGFRRALARKIEMFSGVAVDPDRELTVTCGSTEAMAASLMAILDPGDRFGVISPFYENYAADGILADAHAVHLPLHGPEFRWDPDELQTLFASGIKAFVLCNPSNPCGRVFTKDELQQIADLACEHDVLVVTDEVYEHIVFDRPHLHLHTFPGMAERTLVCSSLSKTYSITGWRLGYVHAPPRWTDAVRRVHDFLTVGAAHPLQVAAETALALPRSYYDGLRQEYLERRDILVTALEEAGFRPPRPEGAYFVLCDVSHLGVRDDRDFCLWMARELGVAAVPGSSFFREERRPMVRFHFSRRLESLREAGDRLRLLKDKL